jgi:26S proteasome regulatory subunit N8
MMVKTNDQMLAVYVASLIRSVIALDSLINNKLTNRDAEKNETMAGKAKELEKEKEMKEKEKGPGATTGKEGGKEGEVGGSDEKDREKMDES